MFSIMVPWNSQVSCNTMPKPSRRALRSKSFTLWPSSSNGAGVHIVKAHQQLDHGGFACAGGADNGNFLAGFYIAAEIPDNSLFRRVAET